jgi:hypothetical protein
MINIDYQKQEGDPVVKLIMEYYNSTYPLYGFKDSNVCDRYEEYRNAAILAAKDIETIYLR